MIEILHGDNLEILKKMKSETINLIYIDPPFNTKKTQKLHNMSYEDKFDDYLIFLEPRLREAKRILAKNGSIFIQLDFREVHYVKILMDNIFGRNSFMNEIIWAYDFGGRSRKRWAAKHDTILWYVVSNNDYTYNIEGCDRIPYMSKGRGLISGEKLKIGKLPTDVWWHTIVGTGAKERTGYPTQKPLGILNRIVKVHSNVDDICLDFFAGSGSFGEAAITHGRNCILIDSNPEAIEIMKKRLLKSVTPYHTHER